MKLIVLMGLVSVEKHEAAQMLAQHYNEQGQTVALLDNVARLPLTVNAMPESAQRLDGDALTQLPHVLARSEADVVILALSERAEPAASFVALDALYDHVVDLNLQILALIDTRTCDCFPNVRESLELHADAVLNLPISYQDLLEVVA